MILVLQGFMLDGEAGKAKVAEVEHTLDVETREVMVLDGGGSGGAAE